MDLSTCAVLGMVVVGGILAIITFAGVANFVASCGNNEVNKAPTYHERQLVERKWKDYGVKTGFGMTIAASLLIVVTIGANTRSWKPCGQDTVSKAIQGTPIQTVAAALPCSCCGEHK